MSRGDGGAALAVILLAMALSGCAPQYETDQPARQRLFKECMASLPAGPRATHYNDWAEVVAECDSVAYHQAQVCVADCPAFPTPVSEPSP